MVSTTAPPPAVRAQGVKKAFGDHRVLRGVSLEIPRGERFCLLGANGSGKSTLLSILTGLQSQDEGEVSILGRQARDPALKLLRGVQLDRAIFPFFAKVREIVWLYAGFRAPEVDRQALMKWYRLRPNAYIRQLSKGQRQALSMLLALMSEPELVFLDEPTSGLDPEARSRLWSRIDSHLSKDPFHTLIYTTHDLMLAQERSDRVAILHDGQIAAVGSAAELCERWVGTRMKIRVSPASENGSHRRILDRLPAGSFEDYASIGGELAVYSRRSQDLVPLIPLDDKLRVSVEAVTLEDVYFKLTGSPLHGQ